MRPAAVAVAATAVLALAACSSGGEAADRADAVADAAPELPEGLVVLNGQGNDLDAYDPATGERQQVVANADDDPDGRDLNGQICFFPDGSGRFVAGEDTGQPERPAGWGIFQLEGAAVGSLSATQVPRHRASGR